LQSAQALFSGFYPETQRSNGSVDIINLFTEDIDDTNMYPNPNLCPRLGTVQQAAYASPGQNFLESHSNVIIHLSEFNAYWNKSLPFVAIVEKIIGASLSEVNFHNLFDCLMTHLCHDQPIPQGFTKDIIDQVYHIKYLFYNNTILYSIYIHCHL
jgi:hypothetical protein